MGKQKNIARVNISVPGEVRSRMNQVSKRMPVNWSAVAVEAFESKLQEIEANKKEDREMTQTIERLKALASEEGDDDFAVGRQAGHDWVCNTARPSELRRLARLGVDGLDEIVQASDGNEPFGSAERLALAVLSKDRRNRDDAFGFWGDITDRKVRDLSEDFLRGFVEAAMQTWGEVEDRL